MKIYSVVKINIDTEKEIDFGTMCEEDMKQTVRGYHLNTEFNFYEKKNSRYIYFVNFVKEI